MTLYLEKNKNSKIFAKQQMPFFNKTKNNVRNTIALIGPHVLNKWPTHMYRYMYSYVGAPWTLSLQTGESLTGERPVGPGRESSMLASAEIVRVGITIAHRHTPIFANPCCASCDKHTWSVVSVPYLEMAEWPCLLQSFHIIPTGHDCHATTNYERVMLFFRV